MQVTSRTAFIFLSNSNGRELLLAEQVVNQTWLSTKSCKKIEVIPIQTRREQIALFAQMWHGIVSIKTRGGWDTHTHTHTHTRTHLCTGLSEQIRSAPESLAQSSILQSWMFRSNLAGWQTDSLGKRNSSWLRFVTPSRMCLKYGHGYRAPASKTSGFSLFKHLAHNKKGFRAGFLKPVLLLYRIQYYKSCALNYTCW